MIEKPCPKCGKKNWMRMQYSHTHPASYDAVSEWQCQECRTRFGRWTNKELVAGEYEPRYGVER